MLLKSEYIIFTVFELIYGKFYSIPVSLLIKSLNEDDL